MIYEATWYERGTWRQYTWAHQARALWTRHLSTVKLRQDINTLQKASGGWVGNKRLLSRSKGKWCLEMPGNVQEGLLEMLLTNRSPDKTIDLSDNLSAPIPDIVELVVCTRQLKLEPLLVWLSDTWLAVLTNRSPDKTIDLSDNLSDPIPDIVELVVCTRQLKLEPLLVWLSDTWIAVFTDR